MYIDALSFELKSLCLSNPQGEDVTKFHQVGGPTAAFPALVASLVVQKMPFEKSLPFELCNLGLSASCVRNTSAWKGPCSRTLTFVYPNCFALTAVSHFIQVVFVVSAMTLGAIIWLGCAFPCLAEHLRCSDAKLYGQIGCFIRQDEKFLEQQTSWIAEVAITQWHFLRSAWSAFMLSTRACPWAWAASFAAFFTTILLLVHFRTRAQHFAGMAYQSLPSRDDVGITEERKQAATFLFDGTMQAADILLDLKVGISFCLQGMMLFGPLLLIIPVASGLVCFVYKRWSWELAPHNHTDAAGKKTDFFYQAKSRKGEKRPGWMKALLQMLQVEGVVTAYKAFRDPLHYRQDWTVDKAFNGLIENFPSCLIQSYAFLCMEQTNKLSTPLDTSIQVMSIMTSCYTMSSAMRLISLELLPAERIDAQISMQIMMTQFLDVCARLCALAALGVALRPAVAMTSNRQFVLPLVLVIELVMIASVTGRTLRWRTWFSSEALLSLAASFFTVPMLVFNTSPVCNYSTMMNLQSFAIAWRTLEMLIVQCLVWYKVHTASEPHVCLCYFAFFAAGALVWVVVSTVRDQWCRCAGDPIWPSILSKGFGAAHWASALGNVDRLDRLHQLVPDSFMVQSNDGALPSHYAALSGRENCVKVLHQLVPDSFTVPDKDGDLPSHYAALSGRENCVKVLHQLVPDSFTVQSNDGRLPSHVAAEKGHENCVKVLHQLVPDSFTVPDKYGALPVHRAAFNGQENCVKVLHQLVPNSFTVPDNGGRLPSHVAAEKGHENCVKVLHQLVPDSFTVQNNVGRLPSHFAAENGHENCVKVLHQLVPDSFTAPDQYGDLPSHYAARNGHENCVKVLHQLVPDSFTVQTNDGALPTGALPSHLAAMNGHESCVKVLHQLVPDSFTVQSNDGSLPSHVAAEKGHENCVKVLHQLVPDSFTVPDKYGALPVHLAAMNGHESCVKVLHQLVPDSFTVQNKNGLVPSHYAGLNGHENCVKVLHQLVPDSFTVQDNYGNLPSHLAARNGHENCVKVLQGMATRTA